MQAAAVLLLQAVALFVVHVHVKANVEHNEL